MALNNNDTISILLNVKRWKMDNFVIQIPLRHTALPDLSRSKLINTYVDMEASRGKEDDKLYVVGLYDDICSAML